MLLIEEQILLPHRWKLSFFNNWCQRVYSIVQRERIFDLIEGEKGIKYDMLICSTFAAKCGWSFLTLCLFVTYLNINCCLNVLNPHTCSFKVVKGLEHDFSLLLSCWACPITIVKNKLVAIKLLLKEQFEREIEPSNEMSEPERAMWIRHYSMLMIHPLKNNVFPCVQTVKKTGPIATNQYWSTPVTQSWPTWFFLFVCFSISLKFWNKSV